MNQRERTPTPARLLFTIVFTIFVVEGAIMILLHRMVDLTAQGEGLLDTLLLTVIMVPVLYLFLFRPMQREIVRRGRVEQDLRRSEGEFRRITETSDDYIFVVTAEGVITYTSPSVHRMLGYTPDEMVGTHWNRYLDDSDLPEVMGAFKKILSGQATDLLRVQVMDKEGLPVHLEVNAVPVVDDDEEIVGVQGSARDVSKRIEVEKALRESEAKFRGILETAVDGIITIDEDGIIKSVNPAAEVIFGYSSEEFLDRNISMLMPEPYRSEVDHYLSRYLEKGEAKVIGIGRELMGCRKDGSTFPLHLSVSEVRFDSKRLFTGFVRDITVSKVAERALQHLATFPEQNPDIIIEITPRGVVEYLNASAQHKYPELKSQGFRHPLLNGIDALASKLKKGGDEFHQREVSVAGMSYEQRIFYLPDNDLIRIFSVDISEYKRLLSEISIAREQAEEASRVKGEFLSNMSHELRTPLNAVIGFSEILEDRSIGELNAKQGRYMRHIVAGSRHLLDMIDQILEFSRMDMTPTGMDLSPVSVQGELESAIDTQMETADRENLRIALLVDKELEGVQIKADRKMLGRILTNLLSNAVKFTPSGGKITVAAGQEQDRLKISIKDTGMGIDPEDHERIFQLFEQVDSSTSKEFAGVGLGLTLARGLVELHGGSIRVESEGKDKGSTFTFTLPMKQPK